MMAGIHHMDQLGFGDAQHFEFQPLATCADSQEECSSSDPEADCDMEQNLQHTSNDYNALQEMVDIGMPVVLNPEFLMCGTNLHPEHQLTFSSNGFKIEYLDSDSGQDGNLLTVSWDVPDIISIDCKWVQMVQSALITLHVRSSAVNSGPVKVEFCLADPQWEWKQQKIWQLHSRYQEVWKKIPLDDFASQNWGADAEPSLCFPKQYFNGIDDFDEFTYPKGDREAVSISSSDVKLLLPETFVNDTIIDFYIKYLSTRIEPTERCRYHFFNSFFFRKLADLDKDQAKAPKGREAFLCVRKWTRKIDIFAKDFLFIPVNFSLHWSLLVICYPGEVDTFDKDGDARIADKVPCIMHMNSIKGTHSGLKEIIQSYLWEEWKERHPESASDSSDKFLNLRFLSLELPQQDNLFDCGLFLLHYVERFLMDAPSLFNPMKIDVFSSFLGDDWFVPAEASLKRSVIRKLIYELVIEPSKTYPKLVCGGEKHDESHHRSEKAVGEPSREYLAQGRCAAEPDSVCRILEAHQQSKVICLNDSEKGLSVPVCILETEGVSMVAQQEIKVCPSDDDVVLCSPSQDAKNEPFFAHSGNQLDGKSCAPEDAEELKGSCFVLQDKNSHQESLLDIFETGGVSMVAEQEMQVCPSDDDVVVCSPSQDAKNEPFFAHSGNQPDHKSCAPEDAEEFKGIWDQLARPVMVDDMNNGIAECSSQRSTSEAMDPGAVEDDATAEKASTTAGSIDDSEQYVSSESKDGNSGGIMSSDRAVSCGLTGGNVTGGTTNGTSETHANGEDVCDNLATGEVAPSEDDTTCNDAEIPHVNGISTCSAKEETSPDNGIAGQKTRGTDADGHELAVFSCEVGADAEMLPHVDGTRCAEDVKNSISDSVCKAKIAADKMNGSEQDASSHDLEDGNTDWAGSDSEQHDDSSNEKCCVGAKRPFPDSSSICEAMETVTLDGKFWQGYSERTERRFGRRYKRRIVFKRRKVISRTPPPSLSESVALYWPCR